MFKGIVASPGIAIGPVMLLTKKSEEILKNKRTILSVEDEKEKFKIALEKTKNDIINIKEKIIYDIGSKEGDIFNAYLQLLHDPGFVGKTEQIIREQKVNIEFALGQVLQNYLEFFNKISDPYLKERSRDISGLIERIIKNISETHAIEQKKVSGKFIIVAEDLTPTDTAELDKTKVLGFITEKGTQTSHTAIVARALEIPAVVGVKDITSNVKNGDLVIIDGDRGFAVVNPSQKVLNTYKEEQKKYLLKNKVLKKLKKLESKTQDNRKIELNANIEFAEEIGSVLENNADGIGLFRTEFIYINRANLPTEEEQFNIYKTVVQKMGKKPVTIRTLDIGGDKYLPYFKIPPEQNPFLGLRAIRLSLVNISIFSVQIRAILRASAFGNIKIMFPMITVVEEFLEAKKIVEEIKAELKKKKVNFDENIKIGAMIEVPSIVLLSDELAKYADFFSIGTNDLVQYTLAVDRGNETVAKLYDNLNPAVLKLIKMAVESAHKNNLKISVCGEMAADPVIAFLLVGLGVDELSMNSASILNVKGLIRNIKFQDAIEVADAVLKMKNSVEIKNFLFEKLKNKLKGKEKL
ncbi:MAG: phosphoenolpyruvate--protein phosphotransferase [Candidatus Goldbacteria bacterium]|nr:phosphoenolpyruvate--protein phosphotransferase [Candidatus Goldiibacteriota bacterium]